MSSYTRIRSRSIVVALAISMAVTLSSPRLEAQQGLTLGVEGDHFLVNGQPKFLTFVSYFDALRSPLGNVDSDFANMRAYGVDGVRIFVNWQQFNLPNCSGSYSAYTPGTTVFNENGTLNNTMLTKLTTILTYARNRGLVVDLTMDKVPGTEAIWDQNAGWVYLMTTTAYRQAISNLTTHLKALGMPHVMFDLGNERDMSNRAVYIPDGEIVTLRNIVKNIDATRYVMASNTDYTYHAGTVAFAANVPLDVVAYHEARPTNWFDETDNVVASLRAQTPPAARPIYLQEPERWCPAPATAYSAANFLTAVANAKSAGAAAWMFHTESAFNLQASSFWTQAGSHAAEAGFLNGLQGALNGATWNACHYALSALSVDVGSGGVNGSVFMTTGSGCSWNASSPVPWITITGGASGVGSRTVSFNVQANGTGAERVANLALANRNFTVRQQPPPLLANGYSALADFNADGYADIGDYYLPTAQFWVRQNNGNGTFAAPGANMASGTGGAPSSDWKVLVGDFTADGRADYADLHVASGNFWVHRNLGNGTFDTGNWAAGTAAAGGGWEVLVGDMNADGYDDLIEHNRSTGALQTRVNSGFAGNTFPSVVTASYVTPVSADWRLLVADFTGDNVADIADYHIPSAQFWVHPATGGYQWSPSSWGVVAAFSHPVFTTIVGDFTGDGWADYADVQRQTGDFWVHENMKNGTFAPTNVNWGMGRFSNSPGFSILGLPVTIPPQ